MSKVRNTQVSIAVIPSILLLLCIAVSAFAESKTDRFFFMGDGILEIKNMHTEKSARAVLLNPDGSFNEEGFLQVDEIFGFPSREKGEHISPRLLFLLDYFSDLAAPGKTINMISGYRSPEYNANLRNSGGNVAKTSAHMDGMALDFHIEGVSGKELWKLVKSKECAGVGHYGGANIHLDSGKPRFWEASTSKVRTAESDDNKRIYLSTDYDRYRTGDALRLSFSSVSAFGFGIKPAATFVTDAEGDTVASAVRINRQDNAECVMIPDRKASRFIHLTLPPDLRNGKYRIRLDFCNKPFEQMPQKVVSNLIEVYKD